MYLDEVIFIWENAGVGVGDVDLFITSRSAIPAGDGPLVSIIKTGGQAPMNTHNSLTTPAYVQPGFQVTVRGVNPSRVEARALEARDALFSVRNRLIGSTWYRSFSFLQEPFDPGYVDSEGRTLYIFNGYAVKRRSIGDPPVAYLLLEELGGDKVEFTSPASADAYPAGSTYDKLVPGSNVVLLNGTQSTSNYTFECSARVDGAGGRAKVALVNLTDDAVLAEIAFSDDEVLGERKRSASTFTLPSHDASIGMKITTNHTSIGAAAWGGRILRVS